LVGAPASYVADSADQRQGASSLAHSLLLPSFDEQILNKSAIVLRAGCRFASWFIAGGRFGKWRRSARPARAPPCPRTDGALSSSPAKASSNCCCGPPTVRLLSLSASRRSSLPACQNSAGASAAASRRHGRPYKERCNSGTVGRRRVASLPDPPAPSCVVFQIA
jgi:hypothetical protein